MIIPVRCFTCGKVIGSSYEKFQELVKEGVDPKDALDSLGLERYCCRRMIITQKDLIDDVMGFD